MSLNQSTRTDILMVDGMGYKATQAVHTFTNGSQDVPVNVGTIPAKVTPAIGDSLEIKHEVKRAADGQVVGLQRNGRSVNTEVTRVYLDGSIGTSCGAVWEVKLSGGRCKWETVNTFVRKELE